MLRRHFAFIFSLLSLISLLNLSYANTTGGAIGNLIPAPKNTYGLVKNGIYSWGVANTRDTFTIFIPQAYDKYEYQYLQIKEERDNTLTYVSFGPAATNQNIYRVSVVKKMDQTPFEVRAENALNYIVASLVNGHHVKFNKIGYEKIYFHGRPGVTAVSQLSNQQMTFFNVTSVIDDRQYILLFSADLFPQGGQTVAALKQSILQHRNKDWSNFTKSFLM